MKSSTFWYSLLFSLILAIVPVSALPQWSELGISGIEESATNEVLQQGYMFALAGGIEGPLVLKSHFDSEKKLWYLEMVADFYADRASYNTLGQTVEAITEIHDTTYAKLLGFDKRKISLTDGLSRFEFEHNGRKSGAAQIAIDSSLLDPDYLLFELEKLTQRKPVSFNTDVLLKTRAWRVNVNMTYHPPLAPEILDQISHLPAKYQSMLQSYTQGYHCYEMRATGLIGFFDTTRYYFVYANEPGNHFIGYWGGNGRALEGVALAPRAVSSAN